MNSEQSDRDVFKGYTARNKIPLANSAFPKVYIPILSNEMFYLESLFLIKY